MSGIIDACDDSQCVADGTLQLTEARIHLVCPVMDGMRAERIRCEVAQFKDSSSMHCSGIQWPAAIAQSREGK